MNSKQILWNSTAIFVFILIISGNYLGGLLPCRVQQLMRDNVFIRHFLGYMTLLFFVVLTMPDLFAGSLFASSSLLYLFFLFFSKTHHVFWVVITLLLGSIYIINLAYRTKGSDDNEILQQLKEYEHLGIIRSTAIFFVISFTAVGFLIYLGNKKREFGKKFEFMKFILGNPECHETSPEIKSYIEEIKYAFK
jgi:hypothetical protein